MSTTLSEPVLPTLLPGEILVHEIFTIVGGKIVAIEMIADPEHLAQLEVAPARRSAWLSGSS
jgi:hypothetical protein